MPTPKKAAPKKVVKKAAPEVSSTQAIAGVFRSGWGNCCVKLQEEGARYGLPGVFLNEGETKEQAADRMLKHIPGYKPASKPKFFLTWTRNGGVSTFIFVVEGEHNWGEKINSAKLKDFNVNHLPSTLDQDSIASLSMSRLGGSFTVHEVTAS